MDHPQSKLTEADRLKLALHLGISAKMVEIVARLFNSTMLSYEEIERDGLCRSHRHAVSRLRPILTPAGVAINTHHGSGYWIDSTSRENLLRLLRLATQEIGSGPRKSKED